MKLKEIKINIGGLMRCCLTTIEELPGDYDFEDGIVIDCKYEKKGNSNIKLENGVWKYNSRYDWRK